MPKQLKGQINHENFIQGPLAEISPAVSTRSLRGKVDGLEDLQDLYEGPFANLLYLQSWATFFEIVNVGPIFRISEKI